MNPTDLQIIETMEQRGGHFVRCLAALWLAGDAGNKIIIRKAFHPYWTQYWELAYKEMEVAAREEAAL